MIEIENCCGTDRTPLRAVMGAGALIAVALILAISSPTAFADRAFDSQISGFSNPQGLAIDGQDNVWIDDYGNNGQLSEYDGYPSQSLVGTQTGEGHYGGYVLSIAHGNSSGNLYVADSGPVAIDVFDNGGAFTANWPTENSCGLLRVAVDNSGGSTDGRVYVVRTCEGPQHIQALNENDEADDFTASATYISANHITGTPTGPIGTISNAATDSEGNLYVVDQSNGVVDEFHASGEFVQSLNGSGAPAPFSGSLSGVAVDPTNGNILVVDSGSNVVDEFSSTGEYLDQLTGSSEESIFKGLTGGIAVNSEGYVYVSEQTAGAVDIFTPNAIVPKVVDSEVTNVTPTSAQLQASVDPNAGGPIESCRFEYGPTVAYGTIASCDPAVPYGEVTEVSASLGGLSTEAKYHFRIVVGNANGTKKGPDRTFTPHFVGQIATEAATDVQKTIVSLNGSFVGNGEDTHYLFEWGESTSYGNTTAVPPGEDAGSPLGPTPTTESAILTGLQAETEYHYRLVAKNGLGTSFGEDQAVQTLGPAVEGLLTEAATQLKASGATINGSFVGNGEDTHYLFEWGESTSYGNTTAVPPGEDAGSPLGPTPTTESAILTGLQAETEYHYRLVARNAIGVTRGLDQSFKTSGPVADLETGIPSDLQATSATFNGSFDPEPLDTHYYFVYSYTSCQWSESIPPELETCNGGPTEEAPAGGADAGIPSGPTNVSAAVSNLEPDTSYSVTIVASNGLGTSTGQSVTFKTPPAPPQFRNSATEEVHTNVATVGAEVYAGESSATSFNEPGEQYTEYYFEYGLENCATSQCSSTAKISMGRAISFRAVSGDLEHLTPGTTYHWRVAAVNSNGLTPTYGPDETFKTFPFVELNLDSCTNAHARQQTGAAGLLDCRAYELVSSPNAGSYDVESDLVPGETPFRGYPDAGSPPRLLYGIHDGGVAGSGNPTNNGVDPYVATRTAQGWDTEYVGIPANIDPASPPFSSPLAEADASLDTFAFAGGNLCRPCFEEGIESGLPLRLANRDLVQGMSGSLAPGASAVPNGYVAKYLSPDGNHLIFGSDSSFEPDASGNGDVSIYDRDLSTGETHVVSKTPFGENLPCLQGAGNCHSPGDSNGIAELGLSNDGSRIIVAQKVSTDANGNVYWHPYLNVDDSSKTTDLTPGGFSGSLFDGMSEDGARSFFTTADSLLGEDTDASADIYEADVGSEGNLALRLVSTSGGAGNTDACSAASNSTGAHWNTLGNQDNCNVLAIGGQGGVATAAGKIYFLSPEQLDGPSSGSLGQPNLYVAGPGVGPRFVATLSPEDPVVIDAKREAGTRRTADFQVTPGGGFAAFTSQNRIGEYDNGGHLEVYRYDANEESLACVSCKPTGVAASGSATLASSGLSLTSDGRVFFNSPDALVLRDTDGKKDVYEWEAGTVQLISAGSSAFDSSLLSVSADGTDSYFFTRDALAPQDPTGPTVKVYDAREGGGFPYSPPAVQCQASDECHGPGSPIPNAPNLHVNPGNSGNAPNQPVKCKTRRVRRHGKCVKRHGKKGRHHRGHKAEHRGPAR